MDAVTSRFETWKATLNNLLEAELGLATEDFPERNFRADFAAGLTPQQSFTGLRCHLEVQAMFTEATELGRALFAPHVLDEANLDYRAGEWLAGVGADEDTALLGYGEFHALAPAGSRRRQAASRR